MGVEIKLGAKFYENCAACLGWCHKMTPGKDVFCAGFLGLNPTGIFLSACLNRNFKVMMAGVNFRLVTVQLTEGEGSRVSDITGFRQEKYLDPEIRKLRLVMKFRPFLSHFGSRVLHQKRAQKKLINSPRKVTVTNPLEIPEINTWSFEHLGEILVGEMEVSRIFCCNYDFFFQWG